jgi:murein DD-endopeptidase MepM/ murein hydrolase activator NlpD
MKNIRSIPIFAGLLVLILGCGNNLALAQECPFALSSPVPGEPYVVSPFTDFRCLHDLCRPHFGIDIRANSGTEVKAMASGTVDKIGYDPQGYGYYIILKHQDGYKTLYAHLQKPPEPPTLHPMDPVVRGDEIGRSGQSGPPGTPPHLHVEFLNPNDPCLGLLAVFCGHIDPRDCMVPEILLAPTQFEFAAIKEGPSPSPQYLSITNGGAGTLNWEVSDDAEWLVVSPISGESNNAIVEVSVNTTDLPPGTYTATITVSSSNAINSPQYATVTYTVTGSVVGIEKIELFAWELNEDETEVMGGADLRVGARLGPPGAMVPDGTVVEFIVDEEHLGEVPICQQPDSLCVGPGWIAWSPDYYIVPNFLGDNTITILVRVKQNDVIISERTRTLRERYCWYAIQGGLWEVTCDLNIDHSSPNYSYQSKYLGTGTLGCCGAYGTSNFQETFQLSTVWHYYDAQGNMQTCAGSGSKTYVDDTGCRWLRIDNCNRCFYPGPPPGSTVRFSIEGWSCMDCIILNENDPDCRETYCPPSGLGADFIIMNEPYTITSNDPLSGCQTTIQLETFIRIGKSDYPILLYQRRCESSGYSYSFNVSFAKVAEGGSSTGKLSLEDSISKDNESSEKGTAPTAYMLSQNYPNPFNPETEISFSLPERTQVSLIIYNILGKKVMTLVNETRDAGTYNVRWNGKDEAGNALASGIYFCRLKTESFEKTMKMVMMK